MGLFFSSGDSRADKRYEMALGYFQDKEFVTAADLFSQCLELAPDFLPALSKLGESLVFVGNDSAAKQIYTQLILLDEEDLFGGRLALSLLEGSVIEMSPAYVASLFDDYAPRFEKALVQDLHYQAPQLLFDALGDVPYTSVLDVGCGTGLMGELLAPYCKQLVGVDLSPDMVALCEKKKLYSSLQVGEMVAFMNEQESSSFDMVIAADVLVYVGDLIPFVKAANRLLAANGTLAFTVQAHVGEGYVLGEDWRYAHSAVYLRNVLNDWFHVKRIDAITPRFNKDQPVKGWLVMAYRL